MENDPAISPSILPGQLALGGMSLSLDHQQNARMVHQALALGIQTLDTADLYQRGFNEASIGKAISGKRQEVFLISKGGNQADPRGDGWVWNPTPSYLSQALDASLKRLGTDYLDGYLLHGGTMEDPIDDLVELLDRAVQSGKIRFYGISSIRPTVIQAWIARSGLRFVMSQYSLLDRRPEEEIFPMLAAAGVSVLVRGALAKGLLAGKAATSYLDRSEAEVAKIVAGLNTIAPTQAPGHTALRFAQVKAPEPVLVVGASRPSQLVENAGMVSRPPLTKDEWLHLARMAPPSQYDAHRLAS